MKPRAGFTLIELCVAIVIFAIGITGIAAMQVQALKGNAYSTEYNGAVNLAKDMLEQQPDDNTYPFKSVTGVNYNCTVERSTTGEEIGGHKVEELTVKVTWGHLGQSYTLSTILGASNNKF